MEIGYIKKREITEEMKESYLDYAMSVIIARALPDVRDGLKPVHRRILYAMYDMGLRSSAKYRKSATVVGEVMGKYHPHGDIPIYDALVRMAQDFSLRYPLVDGQGNWGSIDGDSAAAMRYTEARLTPQAEDMLIDIEKKTVDFVSNYDSTRKEPAVLPAKLPQLLLNGSMGIAVGMATNIPPHNLGEVADALIYFIEHPKASTEDFFKFIQGPDFPTGGFIYDKKGIIQAYSTGKGPIVTRAKTEIIEAKKGRFQILVTEITYQTNKAKLLEKIAEMAKSKRIGGIRDIRDESSREGIRIVIELKSDAIPQKVLNKLFRFTDLQKTFYLNMLALTEGGIQPQVLSLKRVLESYLEHRKEVVRKRTEFNLGEAKERAHILEGLNKALDHIDAVIALIKKSRTRQTACKNLQKKFKLSVLQATAILEMKLQSLAGLEQRRVKEELKEKLKLIKELEAILGDPQRILKLIKEELRELKRNYEDPRRTKVFSAPLGELKEEDMVFEEEAILVLTKGGYIKRISPLIYRAQRRGGKGVLGMAIREKDTVKHFLSLSTLDNIFFFTNRGRVFQLRAHEIPQAPRTGRGQAIVNLLQLSPGETITAVVPLNLKKSDYNYLVMATKNGIIKKTEIKDFEQVRRTGLIAIKLRKKEGEKDLLKWVKPISQKDEIVLVTKKGQAIRFPSKEIRPMGRVAAGVKGVRLTKGDKVAGMDVIRPEFKGDLLIITSNGYGKKTDVKHYRAQRRGGRGIKTARITENTGDIVAAQLISSEEDLIAISQKGQVIRTTLKNIPLLGRATRGVKIMDLKKRDRVASVTCV